MKRSVSPDQCLIIQEQLITSTKLIGFLYFGYFDNISYRDYNQLDDLCLITGINESRTCFSFYAFELYCCSKAIKNTSLRYTAACFFIRKQNRGIEYQLDHYFLESHKKTLSGVMDSYRPHLFELETQGEGERLRA